MFEIIATEQFEKDIKFYKRKKKFTNIDDDIDEIIEELEEGNLIGDELKGLELPSNEHSFKVRVANSNTNVGKSNGYRLIYYVVKDDLTIFLLTVYYKKEQEDITVREIVGLIEKYCMD
ncbi:type II toxin-antitoxin system RelE/ParE family toxin [Paenibacillus xylanexedens]|uniref:type II toxin-antitoxin system RelE/ParE family toxin n=1 Tax=Paenibacillus TaxID=44249 RepID=UPI001643055E|nr:type II toxin-antitoxin system RelE/ParE family toxin [Paenibacillus xylanexedens]